MADRPEGPYKDLLGKPLINEIVNGAQPIDQFVFHDEASGEYYMYYGGWQHCNMVRLNKDFTGLVPFDDGTIYKEVTPESYVEGPFMFKKNGKYYFMWSEGGWGGPDYSVAYVERRWLGRPGLLGSVRYRRLAFRTVRPHREDLAARFYGSYRRRTSFADTNPGHGGVLHHLPPSAAGRYGTRPSGYLYR